MSVRKEVELIIEHNITKRTRVNHFGWDPCATSTPVRKPLNTLSNYRPGFGYNQCDVISRNISFKTTPKKSREGQNFEENSSKKTAKKSKTRSRNNSFSRSHDEESDDNECNEDCPKSNEVKKNLIIKLGSNEVDSKRIKKTKSIEAVKKEITENSVTQGQNEIMRKKVTCKSGNDISKQKGNVYNTTCKKRNKTKSENSSGYENADTKKDIVCNDSFTSNFVKNDKCLILDLPKTEKHIEGENIPNKRKNKTPLTNIVSKKLKSVAEHEVFGLNNRDDDPEGEVLYNENCLDKSSKESKTKLSTSHEIFSECKEREFWDNLDLTAAENEEINDNPKSNQSEIIKALQKKQKIRAKKKISDSKNRLKHKTVQPNKIDAIIERPKRTRKSPKEFWLPKSQDVKANKDSAHEINSIDKVKEVDLSSPSIVELEETSNKKNTIPNENRSSSSFTNKDFFCDVKEMKFTEIPSSGNEKEVYSYALGWKFPAFKCGALKIAGNCESSGRTEHTNSHFGGVLLEGKLLMKIQENEAELSSGQMFCVPPLTDWKATNVTRKDCVLYYWCGRF